MAGTMRDAMLKAGLIKAKTVRKDVHREWKKSVYKNRFGSTALFEIWNISKLPQEYWEHCALCGKTHFEHITWKAPSGLKCSICPMCYIHGRKFDDINFEGLEKK
jgi:hypothetical protein